MIWLVLIILLLLLIFAVYASYSIQLGFYIKSICRMRINEKIVYLTFDDGPDPIQTPKILEVLKEYGAVATFFCIGEKVENHPELVRRILEDGHRVGNHSYSHSRKFPIFSLNKMLSDLTLCDSALDKIDPNREKLFRPPFGVTNPTIAKAMIRKGYKSIGWSIRSLDTVKSQTKVLLRIERQLKPGSILLLHDRLKASDELLIKVLKLLEDKEYSFNKPIL